MDGCHICKIIIDKDKDIFYQQRFVENNKVITVILCESCMAELYACSQCGIARPYCNDCV